LKINFNYFFHLILLDIVLYGDWGLGIGDWGLGPIPNPQSPIPNPQSPYKTKIIYKKNIHKKIKSKI
jgi:hypothetical protein